MDYSINDAFLEEVGIHIADEKQRAAKIAEIQESFEVRTGDLIAKHLSQAQLDDFEKLLDKGDEAANLAWVEKNYPTYKEEVDKPYKALKDELKHGKVKS